MSSTLIDSDIYKDLFGTEAMRVIFSDNSYIDRCVTVEVALAKVQGNIGVIPKDAASTINKMAKPESINREDT